MPAQDPVQFLFSLERLGMKFGLDNMSRICDALGNPERQFASVIVAGTNGKGSVTAMTEAALSAAGHHAARYTSPHLERLEERFVIDGIEVTPAMLRDAASRVQHVVESLVAAGTLDSLPTFFECTTAVAFELFREANVRIAVLEVGLGGRLDATNVVTPLAAAITSIDFDHQAQLGTTLQSIAREKAGVIKDGIPVVCGPLPPEAEAEIVLVAEARGARVIRAQDVVQTDILLEAADTTVRMRTPRRDPGPMTLALSGRHQVQNAAVTLALLDELDALGYTLPDDAVRAGLTQARWPGRLERRQHHGAELLLDAAHNPAGARMLADHLRRIGWDDAALVIGVMQDKDVAGIVEPLAQVAGSIVCTTAPTPRAMRADQLAELVSTIAGEGTRVVAVDDPPAALERASTMSARVVIAGSIFLIGPLRGILR